MENFNNKLTSFCHVFSMVVAAHPLPSLQASFGGGKICGHNPWSDLEENPGKKSLRKLPLDKLRPKIRAEKAFFLYLGYS